jgi:hypothetical protein
MLDRHEALIHGMVMMAAADSVMTQSEMDMIGRIVTHLPIFRDFDLARLAGVADDCLEKLQGEDGLDLWPAPHQWSNPIVRVGRIRVPCWAAWSEA